ncbi:hypothetical protein [Candidatus Tisiphia endosymbiont of Nemotelus uliginosus]|uniref:hypothetical protein n=1 Tax=Candidatus Tisiphia endosymbiont of Nemotelus uliginosus TaxID=3077926 RepID=UPI0035C92AB6
MGQILHGYAKTTETTRCTIQNSQESLKALAKFFDKLLPLKRIVPTILKPFVRKVQMTL